jgi:mRNA interferase MazF
MQKDYKKWTEIKKRVHNEQSRVFFKEREVWFCHLGENVGFEQDGRGGQFLRPVIVFKKFNKEIFWGIPLTKNEKTGKYYYGFILNGSTSTAILSQFRLIDAKRLKYKIGDIANADLVAIKTKIRQFLA